jgi:hypothetical protein
MKGTEMVVGKPYVITGGHGIMLLVELVRTDNHVSLEWRGRFIGHGPQDSIGHWFPSDRVSCEATPEIVLKERTEADARNVGCNNPDCWCRKYHRTVGGRDVPA